ncbi:Uncharacterised protein [Vibrio cholerae]|nr:Uncharacterised protein [Vibrio cholerae]
MLANILSSDSGTHIRNSPNSERFRCYMRVYRTTV